MVGTYLKKLGQGQRKAAKVNGTDKKQLEQLYATSCVYCLNVSEEKMDQPLLCKDKVMREHHPETSSLGQKSFAMT